MGRADPIAEIYDAATADGDSGWTQLPEILARAADGDSAVVYIADADGGMEAATHGLPDEALRLYGTHYHQVNPWNRIALERGIHHRAGRGSDLMPETEFRQTEFYTDFARPFDTVDVVGGNIPIAPGRTVGLGIHRPHRSPRFGRRHVAALQRLFPHIKRAMQLRDRLRPADLRGSGLAALDGLAIGTVICDRAGRILFANEAAEEMASGKSGIVLGGALHGIGALLPAETRLLATLIDAAARGGAGGGMIANGEDAQLLLLVSPLPPRFADAPNQVLVTMRPSNARPSFGGDLLARLFGLTPAEARLALALLAGGSLGGFAAGRSVSENTVRTQLASILRKTGTDNQRGLVRLLGLLPPLR